MRTAPRHTPSLAQHRRRTVSFTRRTHWRNNARTSAARTLCAQHKCHLQGFGQSTTAFVADLIIHEVQVLQRRICLVKNARTCHGTAWSTHLTHVDNHVSPMTLDAKLIELLHSMPCPACRGLCGHGKRTSIVVLLCHVMAEVIILCHSRPCKMYSHHLNKLPKTCGGVLREVKTRHRIHPTLTHPMPSRAASHLCTSEAKHTGISEDDWRRVFIMSCHFMAQYVLRQQITVHAEQPWRPTFDRGGWHLGSGE